MAPHNFTPLLDALAAQTPAQVRVLVIEALQRWRAGAGKTSNEFQMHGHLGREIALALVPEGADENLFANEQKEAFLESEPQRSAAMRPVMDFIWMLIRAGVLRPSSWSGNSSESLVGLTFTDYGLRFIDTVPDHPLSSSFATRLKARCEGLPEPILLLFDDVRACLEAGLLRPGVVLLGLAFEISIEHVLDALETKAISEALKFRKLEAAKRIEQLKKAIAKLALKSDEERAATAAVDFAEVLRGRRNDASHTTPRFPFSDAEEIEELVVSAARHLPALWSIGSAPIK